MRKLLVIGIGAGNPEHMTVQAISGLNRADVLFIPDKGAKKNDLSELRRHICDRFVTNPKSRRVEFDVPVRAEPSPSYRATVDDWHEAIAEIYEGLIRDQLAEDIVDRHLFLRDEEVLALHGDGIAARQDQSAGSKLGNRIIGERRRGR